MGYNNNVALTLIKNFCLHVRRHNQSSEFMCVRITSIIFFYIRMLSMLSLDHIYSYEKKNKQKLDSRA